MTRRTLTEKFCQSATSNGKVQFEHFDAACPGLLLRASRAGGKVWDFKFKALDGTYARLRIGTYGPEPLTTLAVARERGNEARAKLDANKDPRHVAEVGPALKTMAELIEDRLAMTIRGKKRTAKAIEHRFNTYIIPVVGTVPVAEFRIDPHYNAVIDPVLKRRSVRAAGVLFQDLRALMNFAIQRGVIEFSRMARVKRPDTANHRTRYLSLAEIATVWHGLPNVLTRSDYTPTILRLCLVTGQRVGEVSGMRRCELDLLRNRPVWTIPAARSKNKHEHVVPLTPLAVALIREAIGKSNDDILFPARSGETPTNHCVIAYALRKAQTPAKERPLGKFSMPMWTAHDLRRTVGTQMSRRENGLAIPQVDIGHVLNHRSATKISITQQVYDQNDFMEEKWDALGKWDAFLTVLIGAEVIDAFKIAAE